jgi:hypothetical protein
MLTAIKPLLGTVAIGATLGLFYGGTKQVSESFGITGTLDPAPDAFHMDRQATHLFLQLAKYRGARGSVTDQSYRRALLEVDKLFYLEAQLISGVKPDKSDVSTASGYVAVIRQALVDLMRELPERFHPPVENLAAEMWEMLELHMSTILKLNDGDDVLVESKMEREMDALIARYG